MAIWKAALLGLLQGITSILPVSSSGHVALLGHLLGEGEAMTLSFLALLHVGTLLGLLFSFRRDVGRLLAAFLRLLRDLVLDLPVLLNHLQQPSLGEYRSRKSTQYRRWALLLLVALLPTALVAHLIRSFASVGVNNLLITAMGFFVTALFLLVASFTIPSKRTPRMTRYRDAIVIGAFQGLSLIPGMSRTGLTFSAAELCGLANPYAMRTTFLLGIPTLLGSLFVLLPNNAVTGGLHAGFAASLLGVVVSAVSSAVTIQLLKRVLSRRSGRGFAVYALVMGILCIVFYFH